MNRMDEVFGDAMILYISSELKNFNLARKAREIEGCHLDIEEPDLGTRLVDKMCKLLALIEIGALQCREINERNAIKILRWEKTGSHSYCDFRALALFVRCYQ
jgi:hypothetical protein